MKQIWPNYSYSPASNVLTLTGLNIDRDQLLLVTAADRGRIMYNFADSTTTASAFTAGANTGLTLVASTAGLTTTAALVIYYDDQVAGSGTVNAILTNENDFVVIGEEINQGFQNNGGIPVQVTNVAGLISEVNPLPISGTVTALNGGETPSTLTIALTNDTRSEIYTEGFGHIALEIVSTGASWAQPQYGIVAQAYNGTAPSNDNILAPAGIRYRHSTDGATLNQALNNFYYNLNIAPNTGNAYGTSLIRIDGNTITYLGLPSTGTRYFLFDLTTDRFALRPNFTAGTAQVKYRLYKGKHPFFSARNVIVRGEGANGIVSVDAPNGINISNVYAIQDGDGTTFGIDRDFPISGTVTIGAGTAQIGSVTASISTSVTIASLPAISGTVTANLSISATAITSGVFSSLTSATLVPANTSRKMATVYNLGAGQLFVNAGATATTLGGGFMVALSSGDFYECDYTTTTLSAIFATAGTASWVSH